MIRYASGEEPKIGDYVRRVNGRGVIDGDAIGQVVRIGEQSMSVDVKWRGQFTDGSYATKRAGSWSRWINPERLNLVRRQERKG